MRSATNCLLSVMLCVVVGCGGGGEQENVTDTSERGSSGPTAETADEGGSMGEETSLSQGSEGIVQFRQEIVEAIFLPSCATPACHSSTAAQAGLVLEAEAAYANIVNVPSTQVGDLDRVQPFDPAQSYLYLKITGQQASVGGSGSQMPLGAPPLSQEAIETIRLWIEQGAVND